MGVTKSQIIEEIQRCAEVNGGAPPGRARFETMTGIRQTDWIGRYWVRWSDAVIEAGFPPNAMQGA